MMAGLAAASSPALNASPIIASPFIPFSTGGPWRQAPLGDPRTKEGSLANVTVIGAQWGDEGKGKIVDWLAERADLVVRFQGGHNAGHTLVIGNQVYKLSLLPSGIVRGTPSVIGNGVVLDPWALKAEVERIREQGVAVTPEVLRLAETCPLILPIHRDLDALREDASGAGKIGTTRRGIGPAYEDKVGRRAIRVCDLAHL